MPIRPEFRHFYRGAAWTATRARILERAGHRCEQCSKPDREKVWVITLYQSGQVWNVKLSAHKPVWCRCVDGTGYRVTPMKVLEYERAGRLRSIRVVLTVAHLNHTPGDDRDENLKALCQWCHLHYGQLHHHETRAGRKDAARPLLARAV